MRRRVVYVGGKEGRRDFFSAALRKAGFEVSGFKPGEEAVAYLLAHSVHAVVVDYGRRGKEMVREITRVDAFVPLIVLCEADEFLEAGTAGAADEVLRHPVEGEELVEILKRVLSETLRERARRKSGYSFAYR